MMQCNQTISRDQSTAPPKPEKNICSLAAKRFRQQLLANFAVWCGVLSGFFFFFFLPVNCFPIGWCEHWEWVRWLCSDTELNVNSTTVWIHQWIELIVNKHFGLPELLSSGIMLRYETVVSGSLRVPCKLINFSSERHSPPENAVEMQVVGSAYIYMCVYISTEPASWSKQDNEEMVVNTGLKVY